MVQPGREEQARSAGASTLDKPTFRPLLPRRSALWSRPLCYW